MAVVIEIYLKFAFFAVSHVGAAPLFQNFLPYTYIGWGFFTYTLFAEIYLQQRFVEIFSNSSFSLHRIV